MKNITKIAVVENTTAIWEYDPSLAGNRVLGGRLDVIAAIRTLAIKVCMLNYKYIYIYYLFMIRFKHLGNASNISTTLSCIAGLKKP
jgi:hypothetical protein